MMDFYPFLKRKINTKRARKIAKGRYTDRWKIEREWYKDRYIQRYRYKNKQEILTITHKERWI